MINKVITTFVTLLSALAIALPAVAGKHVNWKDDGTVDLIHEDGTVINITREQLGAAYGPDEKPFEGETITVLSLDSGPKGGISGPLYSARPIWEELSGAKVELALVPFADLYSKMMLDMKNGTGLYDATITGAFFYGDLVDGNYIIPVEDIGYGTPDYGQWSYDSIPPNLRKLHEWNGVGYGVMNDFDGQVFYYRTDAINNPEMAAQYKAETGDELKVPETLQELLQISAFFNGKNWDKGDDEADYGTVLHLKVGEQGHYHFQSLSASFAITPGPLDKYHGVYWFDPDDMTPLINSPGHKAALNFLKELHLTGPSAQIGWSLGEAWDVFLRGKAVFTFSWGDVGSLCQDESRSNIKGVCGSIAIPSSTVYYDHEKKVMVETDNPVTYGNTTGGTWHGVVSQFSENPEAAYAYLAFMATEPWHMWSAANGWTGVDPGAYFNYLEPNGTATMDQYDAYGWAPTDIQMYSDAYHENYTAPISLEYLRIVCTPEYWDIMDKNLSAAMSGQKSTDEALDDTAASWEEITDRCGRDRVLNMYQEAIGYNQ